jgi:hypothetical protein
MSHRGLHVLEREYQALRGPARVGERLRVEMEACGLSAKELAAALRVWAQADPAHRWPVDYRTIQHAMAGTACALDTYLALSGFFGWDFVESVQTPIRGADPLTDREAEVERQLTQVAALQARVERERALRAPAASRLDLAARERPRASPRTAGEGRTFTEQAPPLRSV